MTWEPTRSLLGNAADGRTFFSLGQTCEALSDSRRAQDLGQCVRLFSIQLDHWATRVGVGGAIHHKLELTTPPGNHTDPLTLMVLSAMKPARRTADGPPPTSTHVPQKVRYVPKPGGAGAA